MSEIIDQLEQLQRIRTRERERWEREMKAAAERRRRAAEALGALQSEVSSVTGKREQALRARARRPGDQFAGDHCRSLDALLAELRQKLNSAMLHLDEAIQALSAAREHRLRTQLWLETVDDRLRQARTRQRRQRERRREDDRSHYPRGTGKEVLP